MRPGASGSPSREAFFDPLLPWTAATRFTSAVPGCLLVVASGSTIQAVELVCICFIRVFFIRVFLAALRLPQGAPAQEGPGEFRTKAALEAEIQPAMMVPGNRC